MGKRSTFSLRMRMCTGPDTMAIGVRILQKPHLPCVPALPLLGCAHNSYQSGNSLGVHAEAWTMKRWHTHRAMFCQPLRERKGHFQGNAWTRKHRVNENGWTQKGKYHVFSHMRILDIDFDTHTHMYALRYTHTQGTGNGS